jgi:hypothetical protein
MGTPKEKLQTNFKFQYSITKQVWNFGHCDLFGICDLLFGIFSCSGTPSELAIFTGNLARAGLTWVMSP